MSDLFYGVIALKNADVPNVVGQLEQKNLKDIANWLSANYAGFYGKRNEDWKPFNGQTIGELVNQTPGYQTQTNLIDQLRNDYDNIEIIRPIRVYFIDVFALFLEKYVNLAARIDYAIAENGQCCMLIPSALPPEMRDMLIGAYCKVWRQVCYMYRQGNLHRIAMRVDDLQNFRNCLLKLFGSEDSPSVVAEQDAPRILGKYKTTQPPSLSRV